MSLFIVSLDLFLTIPFASITNSDLKDSAIVKISLLSGWKTSCTMPL